MEDKSMKAKKLDKRLMLNKTTISNLNDAEMNKAQGGLTAVPFCPVTRCSCYIDCECSGSCTAASIETVCSLC